MESSVIKDEGMPARSTSSELVGFNEYPPVLWFAIFEGWLQANGVVDDAAQFSRLINRLPPAIGLDLADIITNPPRTNKYAALKQAVLRRAEPSDLERVQQLRSNPSIGDDSPSMFLRKLRALGGGLVEESFIRETWLSQLDDHAQAICEASDEPLEVLAQRVDRIYARRKANASTTHQAIIYSTTAADQPSLAAVADRHEQRNSLEDKLSRLFNEFERLSTQVRDLRDRSRERSRGRDRRDNQNRGASGLCWFHQKYGVKARRCTPPCTFKRQGN